MHPGRRIRVWIWEKYLPEGGWHGSWQQVSRLIGLLHVRHNPQGHDNCLTGALGVRFIPFVHALIKSLFRKCSACNLALTEVLCFSSHFALQKLIALRAVDICCK